jgi:hypothetical protein
MRPLSSTTSAKLLRHLQLHLPSFSINHWYFHVVITYERSACGAKPSRPTPSTVHRVTTHELVPESATSPSCLFLRKEIHCDKHAPSQGLNPLHNTLVQHTSLSPIQEAAPPLRPHKGPAPCFTILKQRRVTSEKVTTRRKLPGCVSH